MKNEEKKKGKGLLSTIWESMTKTGDGCGPGCDCHGPVKENAKETVEENGLRKLDKTEKK